MSKIYKTVYVLAILSFIPVIWMNISISDSSNVVGISDGDTITVLQPDKTQIKVRLAEIDCPEKKQPFGTKAKEELSNKIFGKHVKVEWTKKDRYGRVIGKVYLNDRYINKEMIKEGWAWHYTEYSRSPEMSEAQEYAKSHKSGLWADKHPVPPWEFRKK
jgi:micrococcal nuclease